VVIQRHRCTRPEAEKERQPYMTKLAIKDFNAALKLTDQFEHNLDHFELDVDCFEHDAVGDKRAAEYNRV
jgi:hypothetical protein